MDVVTGSDIGTREAAFVAAWEARQRFLWESYAEGAAGDPGDVDAALYDVCTGPAEPLAPPRAAVGVLDRAMARGRVDFHPEVSALRGRLDDPGSYPASPSLGESMEPDVRALIGLRNRLARRAGFGSYGELAMWSERLDLGAVVRLVASVHRQVLPAAAERVRRQGMTIPGWWDGVRRTAGRCAEPPDSLARVLLARLGLSGVAAHLTWVVRDQPIYGFSAAVSVPSDVRILLGAGSSWHAVGVAFHELGHAVAHASNRGVGIDATWDTLHDEAMAAVMESLGAEIMLDRDARRRMRTVEVLETARLSTSFLFEVDVNRHPERARSLYASHFERLAPIGDPAGWAVDSFRSIDPFHVHAYVVGGLVGEAVLRHLRDHLAQGRSRWGRWLAENLYADGRARHLVDKLAAAGVPADARIRQIHAG